MQENAVGFRGGPPYAHTSAHHRPEKLFLDTCHKCLLNAQCNHLCSIFTYLFTFPSLHFRPEKLFLDTSDGCVSNGKRHWGVWGGDLYAHTAAQHKPEELFSDTLDGMLEIHNAKKMMGVSRVALHVDILLHTTGQKSCFLIPQWVCFEMPKKYVGFLGRHAHIPLHTSGQNNWS